LPERNEPHTLRHAGTLKDRQYVAGVLAAVSDSGNQQSPQITTRDIALATYFPHAAAVVFRFGKQVYDFVFEIIGHGHSFRKQIR
jgi:hypothetical protein